VRVYKIEDAKVNVCLHRLGKGPELTWRNMAGRVIFSFPIISLPFTIFISDSACFWKSSLDLLDLCGLDTLLASVPETYLSDKPKEQNTVWQGGEQGMRNRSSS
jgi:hypothetical protein